MILVLTGRRGYGPRLVRILLHFQLRDILELAFVDGVFPDMGVYLDTRKAHQATREPWEVEPSWGLLSLGCLCLTPFA